MKCDGRPIIIVLARFHVAPNQRQTKQMKSTTREMIIEALTIALVFAISAVISNIFLSVRCQIVWDSRLVFLKKKTYLQTRLG